MILSDLMKLLEHFQPEIPKAEDSKQSMSAQKILANFLTDFKSMFITN